MNTERRHFFREYLVKNILRSLVNTREAYEQTVADMAYFESFESAYPLISESSFFIEGEVERLGIDPRGKSKLELVKEINGLSKRELPLSR
jgi:hypothetical protein